MAQTVFTAYAGVDSNVTSTGSSSAYRLPKTQGDTIPAAALIQSATLVIGGTYQYSALRLFAAYLDGTRAHDPRSTSGNSANSNVPEQLYIVLDNTNFYSGKTEVSMVLNGEGKGSASNDGNVLKINASGTITLTVNWVLPTVTTPGAFTAKPTVYEAGNIDLAWGVSTSNGGSIKHYELEYKIGSGNWTALKTVTGKTTTTTLDFGRGVLARFRVRAVDTLGYKSGWKESNEIKRNSAPTLPTSVIATPTLFESGNITIKIGAATDADNNIVKYLIQRMIYDGASWSDWTAVGETKTLSFTDTGVGSIARGYKIRYRAAAVDSFGVATNGWKQSNDVTRNSAPTAPTTVTITPTIVEGGTVKIAWSGQTDPNNNIVRYDLEYATSSDGITYGGWTNSAQHPATASPVNDTFRSLARGHYRKYRVRAVDAFAQVSEWKESNIFRKNQVPESPTVNHPQSNKKTYNINPRILLTVGSDPDGQKQALEASDYNISSVGPFLSGQKLVLRKSTSATEGVQNITLSAKDDLGAESEKISISFECQKIKWEEKVVSGQTRIKAKHLNEIRESVNAVRSYYGLKETVWEERIEAMVTPFSNWKNHVEEIWNSIDEIVALVNKWDIQATANMINLPKREEIKNMPSASVLNQIRAVIPLL